MRYSLAPTRSLYRKPAPQQAVRTTPPVSRPVPCLGNQAMLRRLSRTTPSIQRSLQVGAVNDPLEAEADRTADHVMRMTGPAPADTIQRKCAACEEEDKVQTKNNGTAQAKGVAPPIVSQALSSPGQPLDAPTRAFFEPRFGMDFSSVRVHSDTVARQSAASVNALAYATGSDIVLGPGASAGPNRLIAHELAHVAQQGGADHKGESNAAACPRVQRQPGTYPDLNMPAFPCDRGAGIELCNTTKDSNEAPNMMDCLEASKKIIDDCKGDRNDCLPQSKCALCACLGNRYCKCTGIV
ncbi:eCIS core domain-containing protein [Occallatibacter riparius]|uniref:DUF4157 domain-containing protein n=1 Tax=Occallatibacter riparius TaxID=1002689 RepID=A0A9J7BGT9_9BACT|nr:DUF4157 domain-containing protein [Occallatibacter riparius]UWZ81737.1 DUF4157 domain-containing protein [Occallatibacter riparius]